MLKGLSFGHSCAKSLANTVGAISLGLLTAGQVNANPSDVLKDQKTKQQEKTANANDLVIATWNVEHLAKPIDTGCRPRSEEEFAKLKAYAQSLDADIVAMQEVASVEAIELLFPADEWQIQISDRPDSESYECRGSNLKSTQQKVAFAVRKGIEIENIASLEALGLQMPGLRYGLEMTIDSVMGHITLLNVHMKSGCFVDNYTRSDDKDCPILGQQIPVLDAWVEEKEKAGQPYAIMGDFNHRLSAPYNRVTLQLHENSDGTESTLENTTRDMMGCHPFYPAPIDHMFVGHMTQPGIKKEIVNHHFADMTPDAMLSDHCAITLTLTPDSLPRTNAVKWQTISKEYPYITKSIYQTATRFLRNSDVPDESWVVVMDIDETILDNSAYQVERDMSGTTYSSASWARWVQREDATLVPGAKGFMEAVLAKGGKLALVTNRKRHLDSHTWRNLLAVGLPLTHANTCLMGRADADKESMGKNGVINDKDLRRQQVSNGTASCYQAGANGVDGGRHNDFSKHHIFMQVGDNIEDFAGVLQHDVNVDETLSNGNGKLVLLPNPMYGSWR